MEDKIEEVEELQDRIVETTALNESLKHEIETARSDLETVRAELETSKDELNTSVRELEESKTNLEEVQCSTCLFWFVFRWMWEASTVRALSENRGKSSASTVRTKRSKTREGGEKEYRRNERQYDHKNNLA